jgi:glycosyltransferase involved in cell wall biosynthesis
MKILLVHNQYQQQGGEDVVVEQEAALLRGAGHKVVEYFRSNNELAEMTVAQKLLLPSRVVWARDSVERLRNVIRREQPDVAHFHNTFLLISPAAYYACSEMGVPVVQTLHNYRLLCSRATLFRDGHICEDCVGKTPPWPGVVHACYHDSRLETAAVAAMLTAHRSLKTWQNEVNIYIALTEFAKAKFVEGGLPAEKLVVKPNFVHPDPGSGETDAGYALFVGRLSPEKGLGTLLRAWQTLQDVPLKVTGDGPLMAEVRDFASVHELTSVEILGRRPHDEVIRLMQQASFLVFPSVWYEGFPVTIAEAFACAKPVIASRLGAMAEIMDENRTGLLFDPGDCDSLAAKVRWAFEHSDARRQMGNNARAEFEAKYNVRRNYEMLMNIYERAIHAGKKRGGAPCT